MERAESQGHRLSSYASSSSTKHSPKTPKKSNEKLSTYSPMRDESLSPSHNLLPGYSYSSINSQQSKDQHPECFLRCTCNNSNYNSLKSAKSSTSGGDKLIQFTKISCDAATSPSRYSQKSPQEKARHLNKKILTSTNTSTSTISTKMTMYNELRISDDKKTVSKPNPSPKRLISTRNAATSPNLDLRKITAAKYFEISPKNPDVLAKTALEKSNSLGDSKPNRQLRTTRSLSPRPPVRHQHAIMVSDENDVVSVKVSPNEDFEIDGEEKKVIDNIYSQINSINCGTVKKHKAQSEQTSPNLGDFDTSFSYEKSNNKSASCLVYIPSDPWLKMSDIDGEIKKSSKEYSRKKLSKLSQETKSLSRSNIPIDDETNINDPWVWRKSSDDNSISKNNQNIMKRSPKQEIYRQTKSFSATKFEIADTGKIISLPLNDNNEKCAKINSSSSLSINRPKLQRCKSPIIIDDDFIISSTAQLTPIDSKKSYTYSNSNLSVNENEFSNYQNNQLSSSPRKDINLMIKDKSSLNSPNIQQNKSFLHVINPNLMQSRHSFSSISQKDDELQLNIRRLSEQIKHTSSNNNQSVSSADFTDYLNQFKYSEAKKTKTNNSSTKREPDSVLETTC